MLQNHKMDIKSETHRLEQSKFELQKLLNDVESKADYTGRMDELSERLLSLEEYLSDIKRVEPYLEKEVKMPSSLLEKRALLADIKAGKLEKPKLASLMTQMHDENLASEATNAYFIAFTEKNIDFTIKSSMGIHPSRTGDIAKELYAHITKENFRLFESALYKYGSDDDFSVQMVLFRMPKMLIAEVETETFLRMRNHFESNDMQDSIVLMDEILLARQ